MASAGIEIVEQPIFTRRRLRMVGIGAGFSNLTLAYKHKYGDNDFIDFAIYEKNPEIGGTWYENRYPGAACDVPAHIYCFPFAPNPNWSSFYVAGPEILKYMQDTVDTFGLRQYVHPNSTVTSAIWSDDKGKWQLTIEQSGNTIHDEADILVNGTGILNRWRWPDVPGIERYQGKIVHSANWQDVDWAGKTVGLLGNGSSGIQILPQLQPAAKAIDAYIRSPTYIIPNFLAEHTPAGENFTYSEEEKQRWRDHPEELKELRQKLEHALNGLFSVFLMNSPIQGHLREASSALMREKLGGDTELANKLVPDWPVGCRRITPGPGYLEALQAENVRARFENILKFNEKGIIAQSLADVEPEAREYDIIVCATGFDVSYRPAWEMKGHRGVDLNQLWKDESEAFMGIFAPEMPNYFSFTGPNSPIGHGSIIAAMDATADYILKWCSKIAAQGIKSVTVKPDVLREYNEYSQEWLKRSVWSSGCRSWYKKGSSDQRVTAMYAGSLLHSRALLEAFRTEDFDITYHNAINRFTFLGNGFTQYEIDGGNLGYYLEK